MSSYKNTFGLTPFRQLLFLFLFLSTSPIVLVNTN